MEWGYSGSGPADFALNILALFTNRIAALWLHQEFKAMFIATAPHEGGRISKWDVIRFLEDRGAKIMNEIGASEA